MRKCITLKSLQVHNGDVLASVPQAIPTRMPFQAFGQVNVLNYCDLSEIVIFFLPLPIQKMEQFCFLRCTSYSSILFFILNKLTVFPVITAIFPWNELMNEKKKLKKPKLAVCFHHFGRPQY